MLRLSFEPGEIYSSKGKLRQLVNIPAKLININDQ
jgi:hypothetical protein